MLVFHLHSALAFASHPGGHFDFAAAPSAGFPSDLDLNLDGRVQLSEALAFGQQLQCPGVHDHPQYAESLGNMYAKHDKDGDGLDLSEASDHVNDLAQTTLRALDDCLSERLGARGRRLMALDIAVYGVTATNYVESACSQELNSHCGTSHCNYWNQECSYLGADCIPVRCPCSSSDGSTSEYNDCADGLHCVTVAQKMSTAISFTNFADELFGSDSPEYCFPYEPLGDVEPWEGLVKATQDITSFLKNHACTICTDAGKLIGLAATGLEDIDGGGEAQAAAIAAIEAAVQKFGKATLINEICKDVIEPFTAVISLMAPKVNTDNIAGCLQQICNIEATVIISSAGQMLLSQFIGVVAAVACNCPTPYDKCMALL